MTLAMSGGNKATPSLFATKNIPQLGVDGVASLRWLGGSAGNVQVRNGIGAGVVALAVDSILITIGMAMTIHFKLIHTGGLSLPYLLPLQTASVVCFLLLNNGYVDPIKIGVAKNFYLTAFAVALSAAVAIALS